jgi:hypothetical protein
MPRQRAAAPPAAPTVEINYDEAQHSHADVVLAPGQCIFARRDPVWFTEGLVATAVPGAVRWDAPAGGIMRFVCQSESGSFFPLRRDHLPVIAAVQLVLLWDGDIHFDALDLPGVPGLASVAGSGRVWLSALGTIDRWNRVNPHYRTWDASFPAGLVDPAHLAYVRAAPGDLQPTAGPGGRTWIRISSAAEVYTHSLPRPVRDEPRTWDSAGI